MAQNALSGRPAKSGRYRGRNSGPLLDRIDLRIEVPAARERQRARFYALGAGRMRLSARGFHRVLKVPRTLANLAGAARLPASISPRRSATGISAPG